MYSQETTLCIAPGREEAAYGFQVHPAAGVIPAADAVLRTGGSRDEPGIGPPPSAPDLADITGLAAVRVPERAPRRSRQGPAGVHRGALREPGRRYRGRARRQPRAAELHLGARPRSRPP